jgi:hypothetical protein
MRMRTFSTAIYRSVLSKLDGSALIYLGWATSSIGYYILLRLCEPRPVYSRANPCGWPAGWLACGVVGLRVVWPAGVLGLVWSASPLATTSVNVSMHPQHWHRHFNPGQKRAECLVSMCRCTLSPRHLFKDLCNLLPDHTIMKGNILT